MPVDRPVKYMLILVFPALLLASCAPMDAVDIAFGPFPYSYVMPTNPAVYPNPPAGAVDNPSHGWETPWLVASAATWLAPFSDDFRDVSGYTLQVGFGALLGGGMRYMDFDCEQKSSSSRFNAHTWLAYFGIGFILRPAERFDAGNLHEFRRASHGMGEQ